MSVVPVESKAQLVGANLATARKLARMSQGQLADLVGVPRYYVSKWEAGKYEPSDEPFKRLCEALEKPLWWFYMDHPAEEDERRRRRSKADEGDEPAA